MFLRICPRVLYMFWKLFQDPVQENRGRMELDGYLSMLRD
jgi:hypothetical protein